MVDSMLPQLRDEDAAAATKRRHAENRGRLAMCGQRFTSTGVGTFEFDKRVDFGMMFMRKPFISYGSEIDPDEIREVEDLADSSDLPVVQTSGFVTDWDVTPQGMYVGAWVAVSVTYVTTLTSSSSIGGDITVQHHFSFQEVALKVVAPGQDAAPTYSPDSA